MAKIDDYYMAINDKIDRNIKELSAIKNYDEVHKSLIKLQAEYKQLTQDHQTSVEAVKRLNKENGELSKLLLGLQEDTTKKLVRQDAEIRRLKQGIDFRRAITSDPDKVEDTRKG